MNLFFSVVGRYVFDYSLIWTEEASRYLLIYMVLIAASFLANTNEHMRLDVIDRVKNKKIAFLVFIYTKLITLLVASVFAYFSYKYAMSITIFQTIGLGVSKTIPMLSLPIGFFLLSIYTLIQIVKSLLKGKALWS
jgi:TRAP-type C4-dicarboxylate transport system permease small subunit